VTDGDAVDLGDRRVEVVGAPGHAPHQVAFDDDGTLFAGDAMGVRTPGGAVLETSPPPQFDLFACLADAATVRARDPDTLCYGHFGSVAFEPGLADAYADRLTGWVARVREARALAGGDEAAVERLAAAPAGEWVEAFGARKAAAEARLNATGVLRYLGGEG
jgi:hydroxyacylglutathione hydrolase